MREVIFENPHRQKHFEFFNNMNHPHFNITANVDITHFLPFLKKNKLPLTASIVYLVSRTANEIPEFKWRIREGKIVEHETVQPSFTVFTEVADVFSFCTVDYEKDAKKFIQKAFEKSEKMKMEPVFEDEIGRDDFINSMGANKSEAKLICLDAIESLDKLKPLIFEAAIALLLEKIYGGNAWLTPKTNDKGADIMLFEESENLLVQVKQSISKLGISSGQEISYALPEYNKKHGCKFKPQVITNSYFNQSAIDLAKQHNIELIDRETVNKWINKNPLRMDEIDNKLEERVG